MGKSNKKALISMATVKAMLPGEVITLISDDPARIESAYQMAYQTIRGMGDERKDWTISKSHKTGTVVVRRATRDKTEGMTRWNSLSE